MTTNLTFAGEDNGNCRVYYRDEKRRLYCWQLDRPGKFDFLICSRDGEPSHNVTPPASTPLPPGETSIGRELTDFLKVAGHE